MNGVEAHELPRYLAALNRHVERFHVETSFRVLPPEGVAPRRIEVTWEGWLVCLIATGLMPRSWRPPLGRGAFHSPSPTASAERALIKGAIEVKGEGFRMVAYYPAPVRREIKADVDVAHYESAMQYHGTREQLLALGVCRPNQFPSLKRRTKTNAEGCWNQELFPVWSMRRLPDESYVYHEETEQGVLNRLRGEADKYEEWSRSSPEMHSEWAIRARDRLQSALEARKAALRAKADPQFRAFLGALLTDPPEK